MTYKEQARELAGKGRYGDTMLVHMNPQEVGALASLSPFGLTTNPDTGLPEAFIFPLLGGLAGNYLGPMLGISAGLGAGIGAGLGSYAETGDPMDAAITGLLSFGLGNLNSEMGWFGGEGPQAPMVPGSTPPIGGPTGQVNMPVTQNVGPKGFAYTAPQQMAMPVPRPTQVMGPQPQPDLGNALFGADTWRRTALPIGGGLALSMLRDDGSGGMGSSRKKSSQSDHAQGNRNYNPLSDEEAMRYGLIPEHLFFSPFTVG